MVDNVNGSEYIVKRQVQQQELQSLMNNKRLQRNNPYDDLTILDTTDISNEAISLFKKDEEVDYFKELAKQELATDDDRIAKIKAQYESGQYKIPSNDELAEALMSNTDFKVLLGF